jgi:AraC-like DNA-binding protein
MDDRVPQSSAPQSIASRLPLHRFPLFHSIDPAEVAQMLSNACGASDFDFRPSSRPFEVTINFLQLKQLSLVSCKHSGAAGFRLPTHDLIRQPFCISGTGEVDFGGRRFPVTREETCVVPSETETGFNYDDELTHLTLLIGSRVLETKLGAMLGTPVVRNIAFTADANFLSPELARLRRLLDHFTAELDREDATLPPQAMDEFEQLLLVSFLTANRHNFSHLLERGQRAPAPWQVRLVEDYIEANWSAPITIETLADVTGGSMRSIFKAFKHARGITPMAFAKSVRLRHARRMLQSPDENSSVIGVAFACGFLNAGHFARYYRRAFGELPSATLANAKSKRRPGPEMGSQPGPGAGPKTE